MSIVVLIGNSDDKLTQREWSKFYASVSQLISEYATSIHFQGCSPGQESWQNACFVFEVGGPADRATLHEELLYIRKRFNQDSAAWLEGTTEFI